MERGGEGTGHPHTIKRYADSWRMHCSAEAEAVSGIPVQHVSQGVMGLTSKGDAADRCSLFSIVSQLPPWLSG
mgnify:CR=1 FL=1